jgi:hypothetical protein
MPRAKLTFRQRDVTAAVKAIVASGHAVERVEITPDGRIVVIVAKSGEDVSRANEWDAILEEPPAT